MREIRLNYFTFERTSPRRSSAGFENAGARSGQLFSGETLRLSLDAYKSSGAKAAQLRQPLPNCMD